MCVVAILHSNAKFKMCYALAKLDDRFFCDGSAMLFLQGRMWNGQKFNGEEKYQNPIL